MIIGILIAIFLVIALVSLMSPARSEMSGFELNRRAKRGDEEARRRLRREHLLPNMEVLRNFLMILLFLAFFILIAILYDWGLALLFSTLAFVMLGPISHLRFLTRFAGWLYAKIEPALLTMVSRLHVAFDFFHDTPADLGLMHTGSKEELTHIIETADEEALGADEKKIMLAVLRFGEVRVSDIMLPAARIETVEAGLALTPTALDKLHKTGFNYLPVVEGDLNYNVGILDLIDIRLEDIKDAPLVRDKMLRKVYFIREDHTLETALAAFVRTNFHLFVVINEDRETVGLLTLRDLLESLVGHSVADDFADDSNSDAVARRRPKNSPRGRIDI